VLKEVKDSKGLKEDKDFRVHKVLKEDKDFKELQVILVK